MKLLKFNESITKIGRVRTQKYGQYNSINWLNSKILEFINDTYSRFGFTYGQENQDIDIEGKIINTEYIGKFVNNYTVFKAIVKLNNIIDEDYFYHFMTNNLYDIYHYNGKYFNTVTLPIVIATTRRGNIGERISLDFFKTEIKRLRNLNIIIKQPSLDEDIRGIDGKFNVGTNEFTIQVKPFRTEYDEGVDLKFFSQGSLSLSTDYLIIYKNQTIIIVRSRDVRIVGNYFIFAKDKIVSRQN